MGKTWLDIGYHYYIEADGTLSYGRSIAMQGAHCKGENNTSIGIAFVGGLNANMKPECTFTKTQAEAVRLLVDTLREKLNKPLPLYGHRDFRATFCPGFDVHDPNAWPK